LVSNGHVRCSLAFPNDHKTSIEQSRPIHSLRHHCERAASKRTVYLATSSRNRLQVLGSQSAKFAIQLTGAFTPEADHYRLLPTGSPPMGNSSTPSPGHVRRGRD
jgi:hypothetical protein